MPPQQEATSGRIRDPPVTVNALKCMKQGKTNATKLHSILIVIYVKSFQTTSKFPDITSFRRNYPAYAADKKQFLRSNKIILRPPQSQRQTPITHPHMHSRLLSNTSKDTLTLTLTPLAGIHFCATRPMQRSSMHSDYIIMD